MFPLWRARTFRGVDTIRKSASHFYLIPPLHPDEPRSSWGGHTDTLDKLEIVLKAYQSDGTQVPTTFHSGEFCPRIWRGDESPLPADAGFLGESVSTVRVVRLLLDRLAELFTYIEPSRPNDTTFGIAQRELLILACTEVETALRSILIANNATARGGGHRWTTADYYRLFSPLRLAEWSVTLLAHTGYGVISPFASWEVARPTASLAWYDAYNAVKHDREANLPRATFANVVEAMAAVYVMAAAQFGPSTLPAHGAHPEGFRLHSTPDWALDERYIRPMRDPLDGNAWLGHERWTPRACAL